MLLAPALLAAATAAASTVSTPSAPHLAAVRVETAPVLDGRLDDEAWTHAVVTEAFTQKFPKEGNSPSHRTKLRVVYDDEAVYVSFECEQRTTPIVARLTRRDRVVETDSVTIAFDTRADGKTALEFNVSAAGVLVDGARFNDTDSSYDWDENWDARTTKTDHGWTAEIKLPLRILRFPTAAVQTWGMQARRYVSELQETDEWAFIPRATAGEVSHYGKLEDLRELDSKTPIELRPFVLGKIQHRDVSPDIVAHGTDAKLSAGVDLKWHPTQALTLDATINPDFAQVEGDQILLNLSTFETYYPEKRPFFLEGIDSFSTPIQVLYTRRIGKAAEVPTLRADAPFGERLYDTPQPATIYGAEKLTGRIGDKWTVGTLTAVTARNDVTVQAADGTRSNRIVDPVTAFQVFRIKRDVGDNAHIGAIFTGTTRFEPTSSGLYPRSEDGTGSLCPSGDVLRKGARCFHDAYVTGVDARWRSPGGDYAGTAQVIGSFFHGGPTRTMLDGNTIGPSDVGTGADVQFAKQGGNVVWAGGYDFASKTLDYNDLGYMQRQNQQTFNASAKYRTLEPWGPTLESKSGLDFGTRRNLEGIDIGTHLALTQWMQFTSFWQLYHELHGQLPRFDDREFGDGTALQRTGAGGYAIFVGSDPRKAFSFGLFGEFDKGEHAGYFETSADFTFKPLAALDLTISPNAIYTYGEPRSVGAGANPGELELGRLSAKNVGATLRTTYTFLPRLTLQAFAQLFLASGHYEDFSIFDTLTRGPRPLVHLSDLRYGAPPPALNPDFEQPALNVNVVLRWEYLLGSTIFLVYTRSQVPSLTLAQGQIGSLDLGAVQRSPATDILLLKASFFTPI